MKLNVGASNVTGRYRKGWVNVDIIKHDGLQVVASGTSLPFKDNTFSEVHCVHVLEHLTREKQLPFLHELCRVTRTGDSVYIEVPNFIVICGNIIREWKNCNYEKVRIWTTSVYGKSERAGMAHHWGFNTISLEQLIKDAGFSGCDFPEEMISEHHKQEPVILIKATK